MKELEEYLMEIKKYRNLSLEEENEIKVITRRIKNRMSARKSRKEKMGMLLELEQKVKMLRGTLEHMEMEVESLRTENRALKNTLFTQQQHQLHYQQHNQAYLVSSGSPDNFNP
uniref:BZIP domain-containing protein n=1 Tax=Arcella intermedia TaxID=1963864 RepID=A0A6B2LPN6_9EUKA